MFVDEKMVRKMKETYPAGTRIVLDRMGYDPRPIEPGTKGTVRHVDDMGTGGHRPPLHALSESIRRIQICQIPYDERMLATGRVTLCPSMTARV